MIKINGYTDNEINYIVDNYSNFSCKEIADYLGKKANSILYVAQKLGLKKQPHKPWSEDEDNYLRNNYLELSSEIMANELKRTVPSINARCKELHLIKHEAWSDEEVDFLSKHYMDMEYSQIGTILGRSEGAVRAKCFDLNLYKKELPWTDEELDFLKDNYMQMSKNEISEILNRSTSAIGLKASRMGLKKYPYYCDYHFFDIIDTEEKAYWLGFIMADGNVYKNKKTNSACISIELQYGDINHLRKLNKSINGNYNITDRWRTCSLSNSNKLNHSCQIRIFSIIMYHSFEKMGLTDDKTYTVSFPAISEELYRHLLRGYFDADGRFGLSNNRLWISFITASKNLNDDLVKYISSKNICIHEYSYLNEYGNVMYAPEITSNDDKIKFLDFIYEGASIYLDRKYKKYIKAKEKYNASNGLAAQK